MPTARPARSSSGLSNADDTEPRPTRPAGYRPNHAGTLPLFPSCLRGKARQHNHRGPCGGTQRPRTFQMNRKNERFLRSSRDALVRATDRVPAYSLKSFAVRADSNSAERPHGDRFTRRSSAPRSIPREFPKNQKKAGPQRGPARNAWLSIGRPYQPRIFNTIVGTVLTMIARS